MRAARLRDQVILVTGSTTGIGKRMAQLFAAEGAAVMVHGTCAEQGALLVDAIKDLGGRASFIEADLEEASSTSKIVDKTIATFGQLDALVNNAALVLRGDIRTTDARLFDRLIAVNLRAPLLLIREAFPYFKKRGGGRVLNIGSVNAYCGERTLLPYAISKAGLMTLTRNIADGFGTEGIRVNCINVGWTLTENEHVSQRANGMPADWENQLPATFAPSGRLLRPEEVAEAALYFLSSESALINGSVLDLEQYPMIGRNPVKGEK